MNQSIVKEIIRLRYGKPIFIDTRNANRYRLVAIENDGTKTAYCFSTPIYNQQTRKLVNLKFDRLEDGFYFTGSSAQIVVAQDIRLECPDGSCHLSLPGGNVYPEGRGLVWGGHMLYPTTNGIACQSDCSGGKRTEFVLKCSKPFWSIRANDKYFALMSEEYKPFVTISCIGVTDSSGHIIAPAVIDYQQNTDQCYTIGLSSKSPLGQSLLFEVNLYESKLFQDTTVESGHPAENNAFGGTAFIGNTAAFGEQWLYTRPDFSRLSDLLDKQIGRVILHLPKLSKSDIALTAYRVARRFCSFGSNWDNRIAMTQSIADSITTPGYQSLDITDLIQEPTTYTIVPPEGLILRTKVKGSGFSAVATGDSYFAPQILEINFK